MDYPVKTPAEEPVVEAARQAALSVYGKPPIIALRQAARSPCTLSKST